MRPALSTDIKEQNRLTVYRYIQNKPGQRVTRTEISRKTGISGPTVLKIFDFLERHGFITPAGSQDSSEPGRKASVFCFSPEAAYAVGASYDGGLLELSLVNLNSKTIKSERCYLSTDVAGLISKELPERIERFINGFPNVLGVGISLPAVVNTQEKRIRYQAFHALGSQKSKDTLEPECNILEKHLGIPVLLENDVNCASIAEFRAQDLTDRDDLVYVMLAGGLGAGLILDGKLRRGRNYTCGEIGYMVWDPAYSTRDGDSGYLEWEIYRSSLDRYGIDLLSDKDASYPPELIEHIATQLSIAVANLANSLDVSRFVLGGRVYDKLGFSLIRRINVLLQGLCIHDVQISAPRCQDAGANGAASMLIDRELENLLAD